MNNQVPPLGAAPAPASTTTTRILGHKQFREGKYSLRELQIDKFLGKGNFSNVHQAILSVKDGTMTLACKIAKTDRTKLEENRVAIWDEYHIMKRIPLLPANPPHTNTATPHPNIVHVIGIVVDHPPPIILLELIQGKDLYKILRKHQMNRYEKYLCCYGAINGLLYLHSQNIIDRDLSARNFLVSLENNRVVNIKLSDFGLAKYVGTSNGIYTDNLPFSPAWAAMESLDKKTWTKSSDVWSLGIAFWEIFTDGLAPYGGELADIDAMTVLNFLKPKDDEPAGRLEKPVELERDDPVWTMINKCWAENPKDRPALTQMLETIADRTPSISI